METLVDLLRERAAGHGDRLAFAFLEDGTVETQRITYAELDERARAVAARLQETGAPGQRMLLIYPAGLEFLVGFFGCLYAGSIGVPTPPPEASRLKRTKPRLQSIVNDAQASWVLTTAPIQAMLEQSGLSVFGTRPPRWLTTDDIDRGEAGAWRAPQLSGEGLAYLQYTSGSTAEPKGVMIDHRSLLFYVAQLQQVCRYTPDSVTVSWLPNFHDYGLIQALLEPLYSATPSYLMSPFAFVKRPAAWLRAITRYRATHSQAPNFAYDLCARRIRPEQCDGLELSTWRAAGNAAELINPKVLDAFTARFGPYGFRRSAFCPGYGLAESILIVSSSAEGEDPVVVQLDAEALEEHRIVAAGEGAGPERAVVGCGRIFPTTRMVIVDPDTRKRCDPDQVGEIWIDDPAVTEGYWGRPEETRRTFRATIADSGEGPFLRSGDLGFLRDDEVFVVGRIKDLIIIRGTNHHPQDIEWTVQAAHPALSPENGAAFSVLIGGDEKLVIAQEVELERDELLQVEEITRIIRGEVAESHDLNVFAILLLRRGSLPKTASGKLQRQSCRKFFTHGGPQVLAWWVAPTQNPAELPPWFLERPSSPAIAVAAAEVAPGSSAEPSRIGPAVERLSSATTAGGGASQ
jgi:acyl-CoA synthetase (AMP-forming)/AMP-acid ligase II